MNQWKKQKYYNKWYKGRERRFKAKEYAKKTNVVENRRIKTLKMVEVFSREEVANMPEYFIKRRLAEKLAGGIIENNLNSYKAEKDFLSGGCKVTAWVDIVEPLERW